MACKDDTTPCIDGNLLIDPTVLALLIIIFILLGLAAIATMGIAICVRRIRASGKFRLRKPEEQDVELNQRSGIRIRVDGEGDRRRNSANF